MKLLITGGAGFIGSNFILLEHRYERSPIVNLDKLTYAGNPNNLASVQDKDGYTFVEGDICDVDLLDRIDADDIGHIGTVVGLTATREELSLSWTEDWVGEHIIDQIPGARR